MENTYFEIFKIALIIAVGASSIWVFFNPERSRSPVAVYTAAYLAFAIGAVGGYANGPDNIIAALTALLAVIFLTTLTYLLLFVSNE